MLDPKTRRSLVRMLVGGLLGVPIALGLDHSGALDAVAQWRTEEIVSTILAGGLLLIAVITGGAATTAAGFRHLTGQSAEEVDAEALTAARRQALVAGLAGVLLLIPPIGAHAGLDPRAAMLAAVAMGVLLLVQTWFNLRLIRDGDELTRAVSAQSGAASFWLLQLLLFGWAALAKLGLVADIGSWTAYTVLMGVYLAISTVIAIRRGFVGQ